MPDRVHRRPVAHSVRTCRPFSQLVDHWYRRVYHDARTEGWIVNHKKIQRLWRDEGLRVPQRRRRKRVGTHTGLLDIPPGSPWHNGYVESVDGLL